jgi:toxin YoeB
MKNQKSKNKQQAKVGNLSWTPNAWADYVFWQKEDPKIVNEINDLIDECLINPFKGTGRPEPLKENLSGFWSRRITHEHRLVYLPEDGGIYVVACRFHYTKL